MIKIKNLSKYYNEEKIFENINISISSPTFISIIGPSGCGKSSLLNILSLLDEDYQGEYYLFNKEVKTLSSEEKSQLLASEITYLFQEPKFIENESIEVNIKLYTHDYYNENKVVKLMKDFNLHLDLNKKVFYLSKGEKKRLMLICAMMKKSSLLICDEITSGLDEENSIEVLKILRKISKERIVILVTHDLSLVRKYCLNIYFFKRKTLEIINFENENKLRHSDEKEDNILSIQYICSHIKEVFKVKKNRIISLILCGFISLFTMGLSFLLSNEITGGMITSLENYFPSNKVIMKKDASTSNSNFEIVDENEFEDFIYRYEDLVLESKNFYLANYEEYFYSENSFTLFVNNNDLNLDNYSIRNINESLPINLCRSKIYPQNITLHEKDIVIGLSEQQIYKLCYLLKLENKNYDGLSKYLISHQLDLNISLGNNNWEYYLDIPLKVVGFTISNESIIYSKSNNFNEFIIEDMMQLPYSYFPFQSDYYPWMTKKYPTLVVNKNKVSAFVKRFLLDEDMHRYSIHILDEDELLTLSKQNYQYSYIYFSYNSNDYLTLSEINKICKDDEYILSFLPCSSTSFNVDDSSLLNGFVNPIYLSSEEKIIDEFIDYYSFSNVNMGNYQSSLFEIQNDKLFSLSLLDCAKSNFINFVPIDKSNPKLIMGEYPKDDFEILISSKLYKRLDLSYLDEICLTSLVKITPYSNKYQNHFKTIKLKVCGVVEEDNLSIYQNSEFPLLLSLVKLNIFSLNQDINKCLITLKDESYIDKLISRYSDYSFYSPLNTYKESIYQSVSYFSYGLLFFSLFVMISTILMTILVNYLFVQESEKEIGIYSLLGYQKRSSFRYFLMINVIIFLIQLALSLLILIGVNIIIPYLNVGIEVVHFSFIPYLSIIVSSLFCFVISSIITLRIFFKKNIIDLIKTI